LRLPVPGIFSFVCIRPDQVPQNQEANISER